MHLKSGYFFLLVLTTLCYSCTVFQSPSKRKKIRFEKYFPVADNRTFVFEKVVDSTKESFTDTLHCHVVMAKAFRISNKHIWLADTFRDQSRLHGPVKVIYFENNHINWKEASYMVDYSFIERIFSLYHHRLLIGEYWTKKMNDGTSVYLLFPPKLRKYELYKQNIGGDVIKGFVFTGRETVTVNENTYKNCLKMDVYDEFETSKKTGTVWLAKNTGLVKWQVKNEKAPWLRMVKTIKADGTVIKEK